MRRAPRRALPWSVAAAIALALLCLVAAPRAALAADVASLIVVTCAEDDASGALPPEPMCEVVNLEDDEGFFAAAPICDPSGASAVAPQPISPIGNDRMEQTPGCGNDVSVLHFGPRPSRDDSPQQLSLTLDPAILPVVLVAPTWFGRMPQRSPAPLLGPSEGVARMVEHPPHAA